MSDGSDAPSWISVVDGEIALAPPTSSTPSSYDFLYKGEVTETASGEVIGTETQAITF